MLEFTTKFKKKNVYNVETRYIRKFLAVTSRYGVQPLLKSVTNWAGRIRYITRPHVRRISRSWYIKDNSSSSYRFTWPIVVRNKAKCSVPIITPISFHFKYFNDELEWIGQQARPMQILFNNKMDSQFPCGNQYWPTPVPPFYQKDVLFVNLF